MAAVASAVVAEALRFFATLVAAPALPGRATESNRDFPAVMDRVDEALVEAAEVVEAAKGHLATATAVAAADLVLAAASVEAEDVAEEVSVVVKRSTLIPVR